MSSILNGSTLRTNFTQEAGYSDSTSLARTLRYMNEIQKDIASAHFWPFLKFKMKKLIASGAQEVDLSPQIPSTPTIALLTGGTLTESSACYVKVAFVLFDEAGQEFSSIESEPSQVSNSVTPAGADKSLTVSDIDTYDGSTSVKPATIHRRIYLKQGTGDYVLAKTLTDNTATTTTITANPSSTIEPPEHSMVEKIANEDPIIELNGRTLYPAKLDDILKMDPNLTSSGTPTYYARISERKILLYPKPNADLTLSYWVKRRPSRIFADSDRVIQLDSSLESVLSVGVAYKWDFYKRDQDWQATMNLYESMKKQAINEKGSVGGQALTIKRVC
jgi:hypothetical protein